MMKKSFWKDTYRKYEEDLPPERVLEKFDRASGEDG
jgi:hypothetical protein